MKKYYIGLIIIGLVVLGLSGFGIVQGVSARADKVTARRAQEIAKDLNSYVSKQKKIPESLSDAGIKDVPKTIRYTKKSDSSYEFCETYKKASDGYGGGIGSVLTGSALTSLSSRSSSSFEDDYYDTYTPSSLYPLYSHKEGENCQTVKPYISSSNYFDDYSDLLNDTSRSTTSTSSKAGDTERQTDIKALHAQIEAYYAAKGEYPHYSELTSSTWRATNMKGLDNEALKDPNGSSYNLALSPTKNSYSYEAKSASGTQCLGSTTVCTTYTLTAYLSDGSKYTKSSLN